MGDLTILDDASVTKLLIGLSKEEILSFRDEIAKVLQDFSTSDEREYQPEPGVIVRENGHKTLFRPFTSPRSVGIKIMVDTAAVKETDTSKPSLQGIVVLLDGDGAPAGLINGKEVTGYRTSLSALIPWLWRKHTEHIVVFGAGKQALWHIRLALALRGSEVKSIVVVNRSTARAEAMLDQIRGENKTYWKSNATLSCLDTSQSASDHPIKKALADADVIWCTVPTTSPLFPASYLIDRVNGERQPYISAIGSWTPDMMELDSELLKHVVNESHGYSPNHGSGSLVLTDDRDSALEGSGEVVNSGIKSEQMIEVGEILSQQEQGNKDQRLTQWLEEGFVIYKNIGVSLTDLAAGNAILSLAKKQSLGVRISNF